MCLCQSSVLKWEEIRLATNYKVDDVDLKNRQSFKLFDIVTVTEIVIDIAISPLKFRNLWTFGIRIIQEKNAPYIQIRLYKLQI